MIAICGIFSRNGQPVRPEAVKKMTAALDQGRAEETGVWSDPSGILSLGFVKRANTPESLEEILPFFDPVSGVTVTADARIDNREDLGRQLGIPLRELAALADSRLILKAYQKWGRECPTRLIGDFALAVWDGRERRLFCARDHLGQKPFFFHISPDEFIFASEMKGIFGVRGRPRELNPAWVAEALTVSETDKESTPYPDIRRLPPASWFSISVGEARQEGYWRPNPEKEIRLPSEDDYVDAFREKLEEAVRCRVRSAFPVGSELSGGLDSSAVTALAARRDEARCPKLIAFSHVLDEESPRADGSPGDERKFQEALRRHAGIDHAYSLASRNRGIMEALRDSVRVHDGPTHRAYGSFNDVLHEAAAEEGIRTILSGFGGDEGVSIQAKEYLGELVRRRAWRELWRESRRTPQGERKIPVRALLIDMAGEYVPSLRAAFRPQPEGRGDTRSFLLSPDFKRALDIPGRPAGDMRLSGAGDVRSSQCRRLMNPQTLSRLEYCSLAAAANGMEYRHPLLDIRLLEFHLAVPSPMKRKNGYGRYLFRRAIEGTVPPVIQWRVDKTRSTVPSLRRRMIRDAPAIRDLITRSGHGRAAYYIDLEEMRKRLDRLIVPEGISALPRQGVFLNALKLLLHFELEQGAVG